MDFLPVFHVWKKEFEAELEKTLPLPTQEPTPLYQAMRYATLEQGKRIRPLFCYATAQALNEPNTKVHHVASAVELIHCFSLIHDDLPCIDNDDFRRGRPTCHKVYGEAIALLAGDALLALAFETLTHPSIPNEKIQPIVQILAKSLGGEGLVGGEVMDILSEGTTPQLDTLQTIHNRKTAALISASTCISGILCNTNAQQLQALKIYGESVGLAFQIIDDILNETSTQEQLGKSVGSDKEKQKMTYPSLLGIEGSREKAHLLIQQACNIIQELPGDKTALIALAKMTFSRIN